MQLKTVEERGREQHIHWLKKSATAQLKAIGEMKVLPYGYLETAIKETLTQDRAEIRAVLKAALDQLEAPMSNDPYYDSYSGYGRAISDAISVIDTLLPGDVSKPTEEIPGFEGTLEALGKI